jgi:hypothetical protein
MLQEEPMNPTTKPSYEPALVRGVIVSVLALAAQVGSAAYVGGTFNWVNALVAAAPFLASLLIRQGVVSRAWLYDLLVAADRVQDVIRPIAEEAQVPVARRPV